VKRRSLAPTEKRKRMAVRVPNRILVPAGKAVVWGKGAGKYKGSGAKEKVYRQKNREGRKDGLRKGGVLSILWQTNLHGG